MIKDFQNHQQLFKIAKTFKVIKSSKYTFDKQQQLFEKNVFQQFLDVKIQHNISQRFIFNLYRGIQIKLQKVKTILHFVFPMSASYFPSLTFPKKVRTEAISQLTRYFQTGNYDYG